MVLPALIFLHGQKLPLGSEKRGIELLAGLGVPYGIGNNLQKGWCRALDKIGQDALEGIHVFGTRIV